MSAREYSQMPAAQLRRIQSWPLDSAVLAVHAKHAQPGNFPYSFWTGGKGPALQTMVDAIYDKVGASASYICSGKYAAYHKVSKP